MKLKKILSLLFVVWMAMLTSACIDQVDTSDLTGQASDKNDEDDNQDQQNQDEDPNDKLNTVASFLTVDSVSLASEVDAGYEVSVDFSIDTDAFLENVPVVFVAVRKDVEDDSVYLDSFEIAEVKSGAFSYQRNVLVPREVAEGEYSIIVTIDPDDLFGDWEDEQQFVESETLITVLPHPGDDIKITGGFDAQSEDASQNQQTASVQNKTLARSVEVQVNPTITLFATDEDVSLNAILAIQPNLKVKDETDVEISACLEIGVQCVPVSLWSSVADVDLEATETDTNLIDSNTSGIGSDAKQSTSILIEDVAHGEELLVSVDATFSKENVNNVLDELKGEFETSFSTLLASKLKLTLDFSDQQKVYTISAKMTAAEDILQDLLGHIDIPDGIPDPFANVRHVSARSSNSCSTKNLSFGKAFERSKNGTLFGASAYVSGDASFDSDGLHTGVDGNISTKIMGTNIKFLDLDFAADVTPGSFSNTGYDLDIKTIGVVVFTKSHSLGDNAGIVDEVLTEDEIKDIKNKYNKLTAVQKQQQSEAALRKQKLYKKSNKKLETYSNTTVTNVSYVKEWDYGKKKEYRQQYVVGIVPITVKSGAQATVGFDAGIQLVGIAALEGFFKPKAAVGAFASGGVGVLGYSAGVTADLWLLTEELNNSVKASIDFVEDTTGEYVESLNGSLNELIYNEFKGPNGGISLYAEYTVPKFCKVWGVPYICGFKTKTKTKNLANFVTYVSKEVLLDKKQTLFSIDLNACN